MQAIVHIRKNVFGVTQAEFAEIAGVNQGTISRWESGARTATLEELERIRLEARRRGLDWDDGLFFEQSLEAAE